MSYNEFYIIKFFDDRIVFSDTFPHCNDGIVSVYKISSQSGNVLFEVVI